MSLKFLVRSLLHSKQTNLENALRKSSPTMCTLVEELSNCFDYFLRLSGFHDLFGKLFLITFEFYSFDFSTTFLREECK